MKTNARVGVVWPAGPACEERAQKGLDALRSFGFDPVLYEAEPGGHAYLAGTDSARARALEQAFQDPSIDAVWCMRGGYGCVRTLEELQLSLVRGKPLIGFSDVTALLFNLEVPSFHGPVVTQTADLEPAAAAQLVDMLTGSPDRIPLTHDRVVLRPGRAEGRLLAGNLSVLTSLVGTNCMPDLHGSVLVLEDVAEEPYRVDRLLTQLYLSGGLHGVRGLVFGRFSGTSASQSAYDAVFAELVDKLEVPAVRGIAVGHTPDNLTLPLGAACVVDTEAGFIRLTEAAPPRTWG